jgi:teichuronic acid exporter
MKRNSVFSSFVWKMLERSSIQISYFIVTLVLARILSPKEYGSIAIIMIFVAFATVLVQGGLNTALIREPDIDKDDFSTIFWISLMVSIIMYLILFLSSNYIALFFDIHELSDLLRVLSLVLIPGSLKSIQVAYATRNYQFNKLFVSSLISSVVSGIDFNILCVKGVWCLVVSYTTNC